MTDFKSSTNKLVQYINIKLAALGQPYFRSHGEDSFIEIAHPLLRNHHEKNRVLLNYFCPADQRIQTFLNNYLKDVPLPMPVKLPQNTLIIDRPQLARVLSLPPDKDQFEADIVKTYRIRQGILHNPKHDRRTTKGVFHVVEGGLPIPYDKKAVPKAVFAKLLEASLHPPKELLQLPFTASQKDKAELFVSLLLRPIVMPHVPGHNHQKTMEIRFFTPGNLVGNLDFVESIFGNGGDPFLPENDAGLDVQHWTGHTGCVILAPHLINLRKKDMGLPKYADATERQRRDGMCWKKDSELYNDGTAFKVTCRDERGVMVTLIADNYFGYSKKEVKTQISYSANLFGNAEEEHSGGAIAFPSYDLGEEFHLDESLPQNKMTFSKIKSIYKDLMDLKPEGYGVDKKHPDIIFVPEDAKFNLPKQTITWKKGLKSITIKLLAKHTYMLPSGYKIHIQKQMGGPEWRMIGTMGEGTLCHKPCTVSGGGKSEISKSIADARIQGPIYVSHFHDDMDRVADVINKDYSTRWKIKPKSKKTSRPLLSDKRSLGSVIKLLTPSKDYSDEYNTWLDSLSHNIKQIVYVVKRHYKPEWKHNWREHFSVDRINGSEGHELKYNGSKLVSNFLRVGFESDGAWRIFKCRQDYNPSAKVQAEDDITASVVIPRKDLKHLNPAIKNESLKIVKNCEHKLFQRPDDCIVRGYDKQAEKDLATPNSFLSNFEPLTPAQVRELETDAVEFDQYSEPMKHMLSTYAEERSPDFAVSSAHPRVVNGKPTKNPRYLQNRPDLMDPRGTYLAEVGTRLFRVVPPDKPVYFPVTAVLPGRRNNPAEPKLGVPPLAVYNPIHYQDLPELFLDFICSVTGKSPSTTGFGSEGALTKGPFNALPMIVDLNNALVSYILTSYPGFTSAAGHIGPNYEVAHDISLLIPEIWSRMTFEERDPAFLIKNEYLEKVDDFEHNNKHVRASILGYRITLKFVHAFLGRIFNNPDAIFPLEMLRPEMQDLDAFAATIDNLVATQKRVAESYIKDGSIDGACPPLKALLNIMAYGTHNGRTLDDPTIREMFTRESLLKSPWYHERLKNKQQKDIALWKRHLSYLELFHKDDSQWESHRDLGIEDRIQFARAELKRVQSTAYLKKLAGTLGADPFINLPQKIHMPRKVAVEA